MYAIEFVTDKIPYLDSVWDVGHTVIRPAVASLIGVEFADFDQVSTAEQAISGGAAGGTALISHGLKAGIRLGVNASPEPASNIILSLIEDGIVAVVIALVLKEPLIALALVIFLIALGIALVLIMRKGIRAALAKRRERRRGGSHEGARPPP